MIQKLLPQEIYQKTPGLVKILSRICMHEIGIALGDGPNC